ncbi:MAG: hypothetical protein RLY43_46, partial [Bacteroidota bacterium]
MLEFLKEDAEAKKHSLSFLGRRGRKSEPVVFLYFFNKKIIKKIKIQKTQK